MPTPGPERGRGRDDERAGGAAAEDDVVVVEAAAGGTGEALADDSDGTGEFEFDVAETAEEGGFLCFGARLLTIGGIASSLIFSKRFA